MCLGDTARRLQLLGGAASWATARRRERLRLGDAGAETKPTRQPAPVSRRPGQAGRCCDPHHPMAQLTASPSVRGPGAWSAGHVPRTRLQSGALAWELNWSVWPATPHGVALALGSALKQRAW